MAGAYDITIYQGADFTLVFTWTSGGTPVNLTGWHAHMQVRPGFASQTGTIYIDVSDTTSGITLGGAAGTVTVTLSNTVTSALGFTSPATYDLKMTNPSGVVTRLMQGAVLLSQQVTI